MARGQRTARMVTALKKAMGTGLRPARRTAVRQLAAVLTRLMVALPAATATAMTGIPSTRQGGPAGLRIELPAEQERAPCLRRHLHLHLLHEACWETCGPQQCGSGMMEGQAEEKVE